MGRSAFGCVADLVDFEMKRFIVFAFFALSTVCHAATVPYKFNGMNVTREGGVTYLRGTSPSEVAAAGASVSNHVISASGSANWYTGTGALLQNGGVVFNAAVPVAATAAAVAVTAVRANPAGLVTSAVASYLLSKGIEYADGAFKTSTTTEVAKVNQWYDSWYWQPRADYAAAKAAWLQGYNAANQKNCTCTDLGGPDAQGYWRCQMQYPCSGTGQIAQYPLVCPSGSTSSGSQCVVSGTRPAEDSDWAAARSGYWSDPAILDLVKAGIPLPTDKAVFTPDHKDVPLSDPYIDPVTGKRLQDVARITPQPSAPETATVQMVKQEVDASGAPVVDSGTGQPVPPTEETDWCKLNPDASGCKPLDEVPDIDLPEDTITLSISPVSGFGPDAGTCPADRTLFTKGGSPVVWSWDQYCTFASGIRPLIVGFAWLAALMIVVGVARRNS